MPMTLAEGNISPTVSSVNSDKKNSLTSVDSYSRLPTVIMVSNKAPKLYRRQGAVMKRDIIGRDIIGT